MVRAASHWTEQDQNNRMWAPQPWVLEIPILKRLVPSLLRRYAGIAKHPFVIERRMGALFVIDQRNLVDKMLLVRGNWEWRQIETLQLLATQAAERLPGRRRIFLDIGAHGGLYAILAAQAGGCDELHAFEPEPENFAQLQANLFVNGLVGTITAHQAAVSAAKGELRIVSAPRFNRAAAAIATPGIDSGPHRTHAVPCIALDATIVAQGALLVAKIDVETHELEVIEGMRGLLAANDAVLQIECFEPNRPRLRAMMDQLGYREVKIIDEDLYFVAKTSGLA